MLRPDRAEFASVLFLLGGAWLTSCRMLPHDTPPPAPRPPAVYEAAGLARRPPVFTVGEFTYNAWGQAPRVYEYAEFAAGNKQVAVRVAGDAKQPTNDQKVYVNASGKELLSFFWWGSFAGPHGGFGYPFPDYNGNKGQLTIDKANRQVCFLKPYELPDGKVANFTYVVAQSQDGTIGISWDLGVTDEELKAYGSTFHGVSLWMSFGNGTAFFGGRKYAETFRAWEKAQPDQKRVPVSGDLELWPGGAVAAAVKVSLGGRGGTVEGSLFRMSAPPVARDKVVVDLGASEVARIAPTPPTNGLDFWKLDALHVPESPTRNLMPNPSFEQGLRYWFWTDGGAADFRPDQSEMKYDIVAGGKFGKQALALRTIQPGTTPIKSFPLALRSGTTYTLSLYAKAPDAKTPTRFSVGLSSVSTGGKFTSPQQYGNFFGDNFKPEAQFLVGNDWTRFSRTFAADGAGIHLQMGSVGAEVMVDGIQIEEGAEATDFVCAPVEGDLVTADPDCQVPKGQPLNAGYVLRGAPGTKGTLDVRVRNAYRETVYTGSFGVGIGPDAEQRVELRLDPERLDQGVFVVRAEFAIPGFKPYVQYSRLTVMAPLTNQHETRCVVGTHAGYGQISRSDTYARKLMEWGFGSTSWGCPRGVREELQQKYGTTNYCYGFRHSPKASFLEKFHDWREVTPEMERVIEEEAYEFVKAQNPAAAFSFALGNEEESSYLPANGLFDEYCKAQHAFYRGVKRANPNAIVTPTNGTSGYSLLRGFHPMAGYLAAANRAGFRYDAVSVHPYWDIDKGTLSGYDLDEETARLIEQMKRNGYPDTTPIFFTEMFNVPWVRIPEWGAGDWTDSYRKGGSPTYDIGNRELVHAASAARIWIICLKYWPKVRSTNLWLHPYLDLNLTPILMCKAANTIGHLMPWVKYYADVRPARGVRGYVFEMKDGTALAPVWCIDHDVENGLKPGPVVDVSFGQNVEAYDLMGCRRSLRPGPAGVTAVPLTPAPLFIKAKDVARLAAALQNATTDDAGSSLAVSMLPTTDGDVVATVKNLTGKAQRGTLSVESAGLAYDVAPAAEELLVIPGANQGHEFGRMYRWNNDFAIQPAKGPLYESQWEMDYLFVPKCDGMPDWDKVPAIPVRNRHLGKDAKAGYAGDLEAVFRVAWDKDSFYLRVEAEDDEFLTFPEEWARGGAESRLYAHDGCLEVYFDCGANGRTNLSKTYDNDDYRYDFSLAKDGKPGPGLVYRLREVNWQFAGGGNMPSKEQAAQGITCDFQRTANGYTYTIVFAQKYIEPIVLRQGFVAGFALYLHDKDHQDGKVVWKALDTATEAGSHCDYKPHVWPLMILAATGSSPGLTGTGR